MRLTDRHNFLHSAGLDVVTEAQFEHLVVAHHGAFPPQAFEFFCAQAGKQRFEAGAQ